MCNFTGPWIVEKENYDILKICIYIKPFESGILQRNTNSFHEEWYERNEIIRRDFGR